jgi:hypothetical protein
MDSYRFGQLVAIESVPSDRGNQRWIFRCDCGRVKEMWLFNVMRALRTWGTASCGHHGRTALTHGHSHVNGGEPSQTYKCWDNMIQRCTNPNSISWPRYGRKGVRVCQRWRNFKNFLDDLGPKPGPSYSLSRKDDEGNYEPGNVSWEMQANVVRIRNEDCPAMKNWLKWTERKKPQSRKRPWK